MANGEQLTVNGFRRLQERLREEGWYVGWNLPCCQSCAWAELPYEFEDGTSIDLSKVLFNHSQDCEVWIEGEECEACEGEGLDEDDNDCPICFGKGEVAEGFDASDYDTSVGGFICNSPEQQDESTFCFNGSKEGVKNLKAIIPIIEECGCEIQWNGKGNTRPTISWTNK